MTIGNHPGGEYANFRSNVKHVTDGFRHNETIGHLALSNDYGRIGTAESNAGKTRGGGGSLEGVFHLIESALGGEDGDVVIVVAIARHFFVG